MLAPADRAALTTSAAPVAPLYIETPCGRGPSRCTAETGAEPLSEAELSWIWAGQRFPAEALSTPDGRALSVINPGRRGGGSGPDYLDAVFLLDGEERRGDVELHVRASSFRGHGHNADPAYDGVALHVVFRADAGNETLLSNGKRAPVAQFAGWLEGRAQELQRWLEAPPLWQPPCREALARLGEEGVAAELKRAGERRLAGRVDGMRRLIEEAGEEEALWRALLDALGAGGDRQGFRRLAASFPVALARRLLEDDEPGRTPLLEAALLHVAGLGLPPAGWEGRLPAPLRPALTGSARPANRPQRRLAALARLYARAGGELAAFVRAGLPGEARLSRAAARWQVAGRPGEPALLGPDRARELVVNVALPFLALAGPGGQQQALELLAGLRAAPPYGKTAFLEANLRRANGRRAVTSALEQQGLLSFLAEWCSRGGCGSCPLS